MLQQRLVLWLVMIIDAVQAEENVKLNLKLRYIFRFHHCCASFDVQIFN
jgi:hypothetical protein